MIIWGVTPLSWRMDLVEYIIVTLLSELMIVEHLNSRFHEERRFRLGCTRCPHQEGLPIITRILPEASEY